MERDGRMDNLKGILIIMVVLGHMTELLLATGEGGIVYRLIYAFHMPAFIFISGYFAKFDLKKILGNMLWPYLIFQLLYTLYDRLILLNDAHFSLIRPYWIMWYIFAMMVWSLLLPLFTHWKSRNIRAALFAITVVISLVSGFTDKIGLDFSLERICVYLPFFVLGSYFSDMDLNGFCQRHIKIISMTAAVAFGAVVAAIVVHYSEFSYVWLYENAPYDVSNEPVHIRALHLLFAFVFIAYMILLTPHRPIRLLSTVGQRTMPIYLLHGFIIRLLFDKNVGPLLTSQPDMIMYIIIILATAVIVLLLSSDTVLKAASPLMRLPQKHRRKQGK